MSRPNTTPDRVSGSLTLTVREGEELRVVTPSGDEVTFYVAQLSNARASINVRAPRAWPIVRQTPEA